MADGSDFSQDRFERTIAAFEAAPFEADRWLEGLEGLAAAGGGWSAHIIGVSPARGLLFNWASAIPDDAMAEFEAYDGSSPSLNPRAAAGFRLEPMGILADVQCISPEERRRWAIFPDLFDPHDANHAIMARPPDVGDARVLASVLRSARQGGSQVDDHRRMARLLPQLTAALQLQVRLEGQGARILAGVLDALSLDAFVCDARGRVMNLTPGAEALARGGGLISLAQARLTLSDRRADDRFQAVLRRACLPITARGSGSAVHRMAASDREGNRRPIDIAPLPRGSRDLRQGPAALVVVGGMRPDVDTQRLMRQTFGLTRAEAEVALDVADGLSSPDIARRRGAAAVTVRTQVQTALQKVGVRKASALAALVARFRAR